MTDPSTANLVKIRKVRQKERKYKGEDRNTVKNKTSYFHFCLKTDTWPQVKHMRALCLTFLDVCVFLCHLKSLPSHREFWEKKTPLIENSAGKEKNSMPSENSAGTASSVHKCSCFSLLCYGREIPVTGCLRWLKKTKVESFILNSHFLTFTAFIPFFQSPIRL